MHLISQDKSRIDRSEVYSYTKAIKLWLRESRQTLSLIADNLQNRQALPDPTDEKAVDTSKVAELHYYARKVLEEMPTVEVSSLRT